MVEPMPKMEAPRREVTLPLPEPKAVEKKPEEQPEAQKPETKPVQEQHAGAADHGGAALRAAYAPRRPQAPSPGSAASRAAIASWRDLVVARLQQNKRYPSGAEARREQGVVTLNFSVDRNGRVLARSIARSSGSAALDEEVLAMVQRAQPLPAFPPAMTQDSVNLVVPIRFSLR